ncbi:hypothetical protein V1522DRAFT_450098 [Lipomyces starkeyi]
MCKHLLSFYSSPHPDRNGNYIVRPPPAFSRELFQERLPLILFSGSDTGGTSCVGTGSVRSGSELINSAGDGPVVTPSSYAEELASFEFMASENPEITESDDEPSRELREIMKWATGDASRSNPRMQRDVCNFVRNQEGFIARYKRSYEEAMGRTRSADGQTIREAAGSYYFMRPQNQSHRQFLNKSCLLRSATDLFRNAVLAR